MGVPALAELLHDLTQIHPISVITKYDATMLVATKGQVSTTPSGDEPDIWRVDAAGKACVWWLQNPTRPFEALTTSIIE
jgi:hypothetical protein